MSEETLEAAKKITLGEAVAALILNTREKALNEKITQYARKNPVLSDISECDRQIVYGVTHWKDRPLHDTSLQARFNAGNLQESVISQELQSLGFKFILQQMPIEIEGKVNGKVVKLASGKLDGFIEFERIKIPVEIKSMDPNIFRRINSIGDLQTKPYLRKYIRQLQMYLHGNGLEDGLFILTDCLGHWKIIPVQWDAGECEAILQRLERVYPFWASIPGGVIQVDSIGEARDGLPKRIEYDEEICGRCPFAAICLPDVIRAEAEIVTDDGLISEIAEHERLKPLAKAYDDIHDELKKRFEKVKKAVAGDYIVFGKEQRRMNKAREASESVSWITTIKRADELGKEKPS